MLHYTGYINWRVRKKKRLSQKCYHLLGLASSANQHCLGAASASSQPTEAHGQIFHNVIKWLSRDNEMDLKCSAPASSRNCFPSYLRWHCIHSKGEEWQNKTMLNPSSGWKKPKTTRHNLPLQTLYKKSQKKITVYPMVDSSASFADKFHYIIISIYPLKDKLRWEGTAGDNWVQLPGQSKLSCSSLLRAISEFQVISKDEGSLSSQGSLLKCLTIPTGIKKGFILRVTAIACIFWLLDWLTQECPCPSCPRELRTGWSTPDVSHQCCADRGHLLPALFLPALLSALYLTQPRRLVAFPARTHCWLMLLWTPPGFQGLSYKAAL